MDVKDRSKCVQDEWKRVYGLTVEHEHHHENDAREVWFQAHVRFLNRPINDLATINRIIDDLVQQYDGRAAVLDARDNRARNFRDVVLVQHITINRVHTNA